jgi:hypothetical protein
VVRRGGFAEELAMVEIGLGESYMWGGWFRWTGGETIGGQN